MIIVIATRIDKIVMHACVARVMVAFFFYERGGKRNNFHSFISKERTFVVCLCVAFCCNVGLSLSFSRSVVDDEKKKRGAESEHEAKRHVKDE